MKVEWTSQSSILLLLYQITEYCFKVFWVTVLCFIIRSVLGNFSPPPHLSFWYLIPPICSSSSSYQLWSLGKENTSFIWGSDFYEENAAGTKIIIINGDKSSSLLALWIPLSLTGQVFDGQSLHCSKPHCLETPTMNANMSLPASWGNRESN